MSLVLICTSVLLCVCMWVGGWLNVPVEFLFQNRISSESEFIMPEMSPPQL